MTGDRIIVDFSINDAFMGQEIHDSGNREIDFSVQGDDFLDYVDLVKNGKTIERFNPPFTLPAQRSHNVRAKMRFQWGWGQKDRFTEWDGTLRLSDGLLRNVIPCFRAQPSEGAERGAEKERGALEKGGTLISRITNQDESSVSFHSYSFGNPTPLTPINNSIVLDVEMPSNATIKASINGRNFEHSLAKLIEGLAFSSCGWLSRCCGIFLSRSAGKSIFIEGPFPRYETGKTDGLLLPMRAAEK